MSRAPPAVIVASAVSPHVDDLQLNKVKKFVRSHVAYLSGRVFDWGISRDRQNCYSFQQTVMHRDLTIFCARVSLLVFNRDELLPKASLPYG